MCAGSPPVSPRSPQLSNFLNNSNTAMATLQWDTPDGSAVDNYSVTISPPADPLPVIIAFPMPSLTLTLQYNTLYMVNLTGANCVGNGDTLTFSFELGTCTIPFVMWKQCISKLPPVTQATSACVWLKAPVY